MSVHRSGVALASAIGLLSAIAIAMAPSAAPPLGIADLTVNSVDHANVTGDWQTLTIGGTVDVEIENLGGADAGGFDLLLFEDLNDNGVYDAGTDTQLGLVAVAGLTAGTSQVESVPVSGEVTFRDNLIHATVDPDDLVGEGNEANNTLDSGEFCQLPPPPPGPLDPVLEWSWTTSAVEPNSLNVMMTPAVIDISGDGVPDVIFGSTISQGGGQVEPGVLRALNGDDGTEIFTLDAPGLTISTTFNIAVGDIDGDGLPEILAAAIDNMHLFCFEHDGVLKWTSDPLEPLRWGGASIADLDGDSSPEIVVGRQALDANGSLLWTGAGGTGGLGTGALSLVADVDLDGQPNVVAGNTAYNPDGTILWSVGILDGYTAIANLDADPTPEIVHVAQAQIHVLAGESGAIECGPQLLFGGGNGGPPTIADYDNDGQAEFGIAGGTQYAVYEADCSFKWGSPTQDFSSNRTGSSVFDFNGDGSAEVVYRDELFLRIYQGTDGTVLWSTPMSSCTWHEYVLVADVDADGNSEIVAVANNNCGLGSQRGVFVYGSESDNWVPTRQIWNQHTYHITNVNDDGTIPTVEDNNWLTPSGDPYNNYRQNVLSDGLSPLSAPDLTASFIQLAPGMMTGRIGNGGAVLVGAGIPVSFYDGDPNGGGVLLGTVATLGPLEPGEFEDVTLAAALPATEVWVSADDSGGLVSTENECDEDNNIHGRLIRAPYFDNFFDCGATFFGDTAGDSISFTVTALDDDAGDVVTLTAVGVPSGATHTPPLPTDGNPVSSIFSWTPQPGDGGSYAITYTATDGVESVECIVNLEVEEVTQSIELSPPNAINVVGTEHTVTATVTDSQGNPVFGTQVVFEVIAGPHTGEFGMDSTDGNGEATFTYMGLDTGLDTIEGCFIDNLQVEQCDTVTKEWVAECYLVIGRGPGSAVFTPAQHTLSTQLDEVREVHPVLTTQLYEIALPSAAPPAFGGSGPMASVGLLRSARRSFAVQVIMYNEELYPSEPEQHSYGLLVHIDSAGNVATVPFGTGTMAVWTQTIVGSDGKRYLRFPFTMPQ